MYHIIIVINKALESNLLRTPESSIDNLNKRDEWRYKVNKDKIKILSKQINSSLVPNTRYVNSSTKDDWIHLKRYNDTLHSELIKESTWAKNIYTQKKDIS